MSSTKQPPRYQMTIQMWNSMPSSLRKTTRIGRDVSYETKVNGDWTPVSLVKPLDLSPKKEPSNGQGEAATNDGVSALDILTAVTITLAATGIPPLP